MEKELVLQKNYADIYFLPQLHTIYAIWKYPANTSNELWKESRLEYVTLLKRYMPKATLHNSQETAFIISIALQEWNDTEINPQIWNLGIRFVGLIVNQDLIHKLSVEQAVEEKNSSKFTVHFFDAEQPALDWISHAIKQ